MKFELVINVTPVLAEQLADDYIKRGFKEYLARKLKATEEDLRSEKYDEKAVSFMLDHFRKVHDYWKAINGDIIGKLRELQEGGYIGVITSAATYGYLPLLVRDEAIRSQLANGILTYEKHFGRKPRGYGCLNAPTSPGENSHCPAEGGCRDRESRSSSRSRSGVLLRGEQLD